MIPSIYVRVVASIALSLMAVGEVAQASERHITGNASGTFLTANFDFDEANESTPAVELDLQGGLSVLGRISDHLVTETKADSTVSCPSGQLGLSLVSSSAYSAVFTSYSKGDQIYIGGPASVSECFNPDNGASTVKGTATISGGTGRFASATGTESFQCTGQTLAVDPSFHLFGAEGCSKTLDISF
jgi:hypothetical protein